MIFVLFIFYSFSSLQFLLFIPLDSSTYRENRLLNEKTSVIIFVKWLLRYDKWLKFFIIYQWSFGSTINCHLRKQAIINSLQKTFRNSCYAILGVIKMFSIIIFVRFALLFRFDSNCIILLAYVSGHIMLLAQRNCVIKEIISKGKMISF